MKKTILAFALGLSLVAANAQAKPISFNFSGKWTSVAEDLSFWFPSGAEFNGNIIYDSAATLTDNPDGPDYYAGQLLTFSTQALAFTVTPPEITIYNAESSAKATSSSTGNLSDQFVIDIRNHVNFTVNPPGLLGLISANFSLTGIDNTVFNDTSLPTLDVMTSTKLFQPGMFTLSFYVKENPSIRLAAGGTIDSITHPTPEPATLLLFATGLTGLAAHRRRRAH